MSRTNVIKKGCSKEPMGSVLQYGSDKIHYHIIRKPDDNATKNRKVTIKVHPDKRVIAMAPSDASDVAIHNAVLKRARWIWKNLEDFNKQTDAVLPKQYVSGETQFYLGKRYVLKVHIDPEQEPNVKLHRGKLNVTLPVDGPDKKKHVKQLLDKWYQEKAKATFKLRLRELLNKTTWVTNTPAFKLRLMKKQWGSCSAKGSLILNPHLVKAPKECIDYVILHELCHIAEHNHSERFWRLLTQVMPNWKEVKAKLDDMAEMYLNE